MIVNYFCLKSVLYVTVIAFLYMKIIIIKMKFYVFLEFNKIKEYFILLN